MSKKVILVHPSDETGFAVYPLSSLYLAAFLEREGYEPIIFDHNDFVDYKNILSHHLKDAVCVGVSSLTGTQIRNGLEICQWIRGVNPELPIVWGGHHPTACPEQTVSDRMVDIVVRHEGELTFTELVKALDANIPLQEIKGITYKDNGMIKNNPLRFPLNLAEMPDIPWHMIDIKRKLENSVDRSISIQTGRGCPFDCTFCSHEKTGMERYRMFSAEYLLNNLEPRIKKYNIKKVNFFEPLFITNKKKLRELCSGLLSRHLEVEWIASARADCFTKLDDEHFQLIKESGCRFLTFGFESGSPETLKRINKKTTVKNAIDSAKLCHKYSIRSDACFIVGFPFETLKDTLQTVMLAATVRHINPDTSIHLQTYTTYPGTILYKECLGKYGLKEVQSLEEWGKLEWANSRPWLKGWGKYFIRGLRGSMYASSPSYLINERKDIRFVRLLHFPTLIIYELIYFLSLIFQKFKKE